MARTPIWAADRLLAGFCASLLPVKADRRTLGSAATVLTARERSADPLARADTLRQEHRIAEAIITTLSLRGIVLFDYFDYIASIRWLRVRVAGSTGRRSRDAGQGATSPGFSPEADVGLPTPLARVRDCEERMLRGAALHWPATRRRRSRADGKHTRISRLLLRLGLLRNLKIDGGYSRGPRVLQRLSFSSGARAPGNRRGSQPGQQLRICLFQRTHRTHQSTAMASIAAKSFVGTAIASAPKVCDSSAASRADPRLRIASMHV